jgi:hypothetical protein
MEFVADKVVLGHAFIRILLFSPVNITSGWLSTLEPGTPR